MRGAVDKVIGEMQSQIEIQEFTDAHLILQPRHRFPALDFALAEKGKYRIVCGIVDNLRKCFRFKHVVRRALRQIIANCGNQASDQSSNAPKSMTELRVSKEFLAGLNPVKVSSDALWAR